MLQARADMSLLASLATVATLNCVHVKFHSALPPAATALQYTAERRFGWILQGTAADKLCLFSKKLKIGLVYHTSLYLFFIGENQRKRMAF